MDFSEISAGKHGSSSTGVFMIRNLGCLGEGICTNQGFLSDYFHRNIGHIRRDSHVITGPSWKQAVALAFHLQVQVKNWHVVTTYQDNTDQTTALKLSEYGLHIGWKTKTSFHLRCSEKQFRKLVRTSYKNQGGILGFNHATFERRLDNVVYRLVCDYSSSSSSIRKPRSHPCWRKTRWYPIIRVTRGQTISVQKIIESSSNLEQKLLGRPAFVSFDAENWKVHWLVCQNALKSTQKSTKHFVVEFYNKML